MISLIPEKCILGGLIAVFVLSIFSVNARSQTDVVIPLESLKYHENKYNENAHHSPNNSDYAYAKGYWYFLDEDSNKVPVKYATVHVYDEDINIWTGKITTDFLGSTKTNENGYWAIGFQNTDHGGAAGQDVIAKLFSATQEIKVKYYSDNLYSWQTHKIDQLKDGATADFGSYTIIDNNKGALNIYDTLVDGFCFLYPAYANPGTCFVQWEYGGNKSSYYDRGKDVCIKSGDANYRDIILREGAKNFLWNINGGWLPQTLSQASYIISQKTDAFTAWVDGWAYFFPLIVKNDSCFNASNWSCNVELTSNVWEHGDEISGRVTGALWDLYDSQSDGFDNCSFDFSKIWTVIRRGKIGEFKDFWNAWGFSRHNAVCAIYQNTIDYDNAPVIHNLPDQIILENTIREMAIDLRSYVYDIESKHDELTYSIINQSNSNCGVFINNYYVGINPAPDWFGECDVVIEVSDIIKTDRDTFHVTVKAAPPVADFTASPTSGHLPLTVQFTDQSQNRVSSWLWDFGDSTISNVQHPTHIYSKNGVYSVTLTVTGPGGADSTTKENYIFVNTLPVVTDLFIEPLRPLSSDSLVANYTYSDGDGHEEQGSEICWYQNDELQTHLNNMKVVSHENTSYGEQWHFTVKPKDGFEFGLLQESPKVIVNTPPIASTLKIVPENPLDSENLTAQYEYEDNEKDPETDSEFRWFRNNVEVTSLNNQKSVPASETTAGDKWHFTIKPYDGLEFGTIETSPFVNIDMCCIIEAETMQNRNEYHGCYCTNGWRLTHKNQPIFEQIGIPSDFCYLITITAKGEIAGGAAPWMMVRIGDEFKGTCEVNSHDWLVYPFYANLSAGTDTIYINSLSDWWNPAIGDRNLLIDKIEVRCQFDQIPVVYHNFEAEMMKFQHPQNYKKDEFVVLNRPYSFVGHEMFFGQTELVCDVIAKGDSINGGWPEMEIRLNDEIVNSFCVETATSMSYQFILKEIQPGNNRIKIMYHPESWAYKRNLFIDKLIIRSEEGGMLVNPYASILNDLNAQSQLPEKYLLNQNYPNPFNQMTCIRYELPEGCFVTIGIYNTLSRKLKTIVNEFVTAGYHQVFWNGTDDAGHQAVSGVYLLKMQAGHYKSVKKMALVK